MSVSNMLAHRHKLLPGFRVFVFVFFFFSSGGFGLTTLGEDVRDLQEILIRNQTILVMVLM